MRQRLVTGLSETRKYTDRELEVEWVAKGGCGGGSGLWNGIMKQHGLYGEAYVSYPTRLRHTSFMAEALMLFSSIFLTRVRPLPVPSSF